MTEVDWGSEANEAPKAKRRVPVWAWFCGGGCLIAIVAAVAIVLFAVRQGQQMMDHDRQAEELRQELPFDELPEGMRVIGTGVFASLAPGIDDAWSIPLSPEVQVQFSKLSPKASVEWRESMKSGELTGELEQQFGPFGIFEVSSGVSSIQGREIPWIRFQNFDPADAASESTDEAKTEEESERKGGLARAIEEGKKAMRQRFVIMDLTREGERGALMMQFQRRGDLPPIEMSEIEEFLRPFHVGPDR